MIWITQFLIGIVFTAIILSALPFVKYKNFFSCVKVSALLSLFALPVKIATATTQVFVILAIGWIPLIGDLSSVITAFISSFIFQTIALFMADQFVEDFEIQSIGQTFSAVFILSVFNAIMYFVLG